MSNDRIRPITTGDIGNVTTTRLRHKHNDTPVFSTLMDNTTSNENGFNNTNTLRPRALPPFYSSPDHNSLNSTTGNRAGEEGTRRPRRASRNQRKQKSEEITDLWNSLNHFSKNNLGRSLNEEISQQSLDSVHFVNIEKENDDSSITKPSLTTQSNQHMFMQRLEPVESKSGKIKMIPAASTFVIPELPKGKVLQINILSTWGDPYYLGLMGVEIFDECGHPVRLSNPAQQIWADPADINVLPEYNDDPRTVDNLLDSVNLTCDDLHAWLTPFTSGNNHYIWLEFDHITTLSMLRIWNYNKNRIHSYRGARYVEINLLDAIPSNYSSPGSKGINNSNNTSNNNMQQIFQGEIRRAPGTTSILHFEQCCECILFTRQSRILALVEKYDQIIQQYYQAILEDTTTSGKSSNNNNNSTNNTAVGSEEEYKKKLIYQHLLEKQNNNNNASAVSTSNTYSDGMILTTSSRHFSNNSTTAMTPSNTTTTTNNNSISLNFRPTTTASNNRSRSKSSFNSTKPDDVNLDIDQTDADQQLYSNITLNSRQYSNSIASTFNSLYTNNNTASNSSIRPSTAALVSKQRPLLVQSMDLVVLTNYGDNYMIGLTGLVALDSNMQEYTLPIPEVLLVQVNAQKKISVNSRYPHDYYDRDKLTNIVTTTYNHINDPEYMFTVHKHHVKDSYLCLRFYLPATPGSGPNGYPLLKGLKIWNYNAGKEESCCGVKHLLIYINQQLVNEVIVRKAPGVRTAASSSQSNTYDSNNSSGSGHFDYSQFLAFQQQVSNSNNSGGNANGALTSFYRKNKFISLESSISEEDWINVLDDDTAAKTTDKSHTMIGASFDSDDIGQPGIATTNVNVNNTAESGATTCLEQQQYETPLLPSGSLIKIVLSSTHGDIYYIGLNGLQLFDQNGEEINLSLDQIHATPYKDLNDLEEIRDLGGDARCLENLIDNAHNNTYNDRNMWLTVYTGRSAYVDNSMTVHNNPKKKGFNSLFILFDSPVTISCMKFYNYSKSPERGVREIDVFVDDVLVYRGSLLSSPSLASIQQIIQDKSTTSSKYSSKSSRRARNNTISGASSTFEWVNDEGEVDLSQSILFSNNPSIVNTEKHRIPLLEDEICFFDGGMQVPLQDNPTAVNSRASTANSVSNGNTSSNGSAGEILMINNNSSSYYTASRRNSFDEANTAMATGTGSARPRRVRREDNNTTTTNEGDGYNCNTTNISSSGSNLRRPMTSVQGKL